MALCKKFAAVQIAAYFSKSVRNSSTSSLAAESNVLLRRATKPSTATVASLKTFKRTLTTTLRQPSVMVRNSLSGASRFFSGSARDPHHLLRRSLNHDYLRSVIRSEPQKGVGTPFELEDISPCVTPEGGKRFTFTKTYNGEHNFVQVFVVEENSVSSDAMMYVVSKKPDRQLGFFIHPPFDTEITIGNLVLYPSQDDMRQLTTVEAVQDAIDTYEFSELDEDLQAGLYKYLAVRGVSADWWRKVAPSCLTMQSSPVPNSPPPSSIAAQDIEMLRSIIDSEPPAALDIPVGSPFEIVDICTMSDGERRVTYSKKHNDECVNVYVYLDPEDDENSGNSESAGTPLLVGILKPKSKVLAFGIVAFPSEIRIQHLGFMNVKCLDEPPYMFRDLDENLQGDFYKYLAMRGITDNWWRDTCLHGGLRSLLKGVVPPELRNPNWPFQVKK